jgi:hypothetical protein
MNRHILQSTTFALTAIALIAYVVMFGRIGGIEAVVMFFPFTMVPFIITCFFAARWRGVGSQLVLLATLAAYAGWFLYVYVQAQVMHPDPQSPIAFLWVGVETVPILFLLWILAWAIEWERRAG